LFLFIFFFVTVSCCNQSINLYILKFLEKKEHFCFLYVLKKVQSFVNMLENKTFDRNYSFNIAVV